MPLLFKFILFMKGELTVYAAKKERNEQTDK